MKNRIIAIFFLSLFLLGFLPNVIAQQNAQTFDIGNPFTILWEPVKSIFSKTAGMSETDKQTMTYALIFLILFMIVFSGFKYASANVKGLEFLGGAPGIVVSFAMAVIGTIFIPPKSILELGGTYGGMALLLLFAPILAGGIFLAFKTENKFLKFAIILMLLYMSTYINYLLVSQNSTNSQGIFRSIFQVVTLVLTVWGMWSLISALGSFGGASSGGGGSGLFNAGAIGSAAKNAAVSARNALPNSPEKRSQNAVAAAETLASGNLAQEMQQSSTTLITASNKLTPIIKQMNNNLSQMITALPNTKTVPAQRNIFRTNYAQLMATGKLLDPQMTTIRAEVRRITTDFARISQTVQDANSELQRAPNNDLTRYEKGQLQTQLGTIQQVMFSLQRFNQDLQALEDRIASMWGRQGEFKTALADALSADPARNANGLNHMTAMNRQFANLTQLSADMDNQMRRIQGGIGNVLQVAERLRQRAQSANQNMNNTGFATP